MKKKKKLIVILGPTASGKSGIALCLAKAIKGFLICADSRQMYKEMDIITGKDIGVWKKNNGEDVFMVDGVCEYMVDFLYPYENFSVYEYQQKVFEIIDKKASDSYVPIMVGGTGLYIESVTENYILPQVQSNNELRKILEKEYEMYGLDVLLEKLKSLDSETFLCIDKKNPRKIIRALEFCLSTGECFSRNQKKADPKYNVLKIGVKIDREVLYEKINKRIDQMLANRGWEESSFIMKKYGTQLNSVSGIGYLQLHKALTGELTKDQSIELFKRDTRHYAKRQLTWFSRDKSITWVCNYEEALALVKEFLQK